MKLTLKLTPYNFAYLVYPVVYVCSIPLTLLLKDTMAQLHTRSQLILLNCILLVIMDICGSPDYTGF